MSEFVKKTWACGDDITADDLNRMEDGIEEALDKGYSCSSTTQVLFEDTLTNGVSVGGYYTYNSANDLNIEEDYVDITFDGVKYSHVPRQFDTERNLWYYGQVSSYGNPIFSLYPFVLFCGEPASVCTQTDGEHTIEVTLTDELIETSECFEKAVRSVAHEDPLIVTNIISGDSATLDKTWQEIHDAFLSGTSVIVRIYGATTPVYESIVQVMGGSPNSVSTMNGSWSTDSADGYPSSE